MCPIIITIFEKHKDWKLSLDRKKRKHAGINPKSVASTNEELRIENEDTNLIKENAILNDATNASTEDAGLVCSHPCTNQPPLFSIKRTQAAKFQGSS